MELNKERLDHDIEYRKEMLEYLFNEIKILRKEFDDLSKNGDIDGEIGLNKISEVETNLLILQDNINLN